MKREQPEDKHILIFLHKYMNIVKETLLLWLELNSLHH